jgi:hypothetical protein
MNGTDFTAGILQGEYLGQPRLSPLDVPKSLLLAVPRFAWPGKLDSEVVQSIPQLEINDFGLQQVNFIAPLFGQYAGMLSPAQSAAFFMLLGGLLGLGERWLLRSCTPARLALLAGAVIAVLWYQAGLPVMVVQMRAAVVIALAVKAAAALRGRRQAAEGATSVTCSLRPRKVAVTGARPGG